MRKRKAQKIYEGVRKMLESEQYNVPFRLFDQNGTAYIRVYNEIGNIFYIKESDFDRVLNTFSKKGVESK